MALKIEDYALIGDTFTIALVGRDGSIDWLCVPRIDSDACFAALLGTPDNGRWLLAPEDEIRASRRHYRGDTLILETEFETATGTAAVIDFMPVGGACDVVDVVRLVEGRAGEVAMATELVLRFDYGTTVPWVQSAPDGLTAIAGPIALRLHTPVELEGKDFRTVGRFTVRAGETVPFRLCCFQSYQLEPISREPARLLKETEAFWHDWTGRCKVEGDWRDAVLRSLITLKALTYGPAGGIAAAGTTSLPERIGGNRNWDYRYCWIRDATFTLYAFLLSGLKDEAQAWRDWLLRAAAGKPSQLQILYGVAGERRITELELPWLPGYENSRPVRIGNAAHQQVQLDVFGELLDAFHVARKHGIPAHDHAWEVEKVLLEHLEGAWHLPDHGIWEVRGQPRQFTHSKVMAWVAADRAVKAVERFGLDGPADRWRRLRAGIHADVCAKGFDRQRNAFVQYYGGQGLDAALLMIPLVGFLPPRDPRVAGTVEAIQRELTRDGLVCRYLTDEAIDGLPAGEGTFLSCSFWLVDNLALLGRWSEARELFLALLELRNDVGLLAEEYDPILRRQLGNFPQAFSHVGLINSAHNLTIAAGPAKERAEHGASGASRARRSS
jgi:GH15 family glucan-1,4-alpha-glucosidase